ncbi:MAG: EthD domain-containing protein [Deltaproteobacteria bacterium]|nr:MAG: EthD domain-containing protein [Deltaproteobacteria bacterium]
MIKLSFCVRRRSDLSPETFHRYWREVHAPLVERHAAALRMRRYVQCHTLEDAANDALRASRGAGEPFDGIAEVYWDSRQALEAALATPEGRDAGRELLEDERNFIDLAGSSLFLTEEQRIFDR